MVASNIFKWDYVPPKIGSGYWSESIISSTDPGWSFLNDEIDKTYEDLEDRYHNYLEIIVAKALEKSRGK